MTENKLCPVCGSRPEPYADDPTHLRCMTKDCMLRNMSFSRDDWNKTHPQTPVERRRMTLSEIVELGAIRRKLGDVVFLVAPHSVNKVRILTWHPKGVSVQELVGLSHLYDPTYGFTKLDGSELEVEGNADSPATAKED